MMDELAAFQKIAVSRLLDEINSAVGYNAHDGKPQVIAFRAPTGSGKTIMMTAVIEELLTSQPESIFLWLSDSPELNKQSRDKILRSEKISAGHCVMIDENFDGEVLDDGRIYFLNTQKLGRASKLIFNGDGRTFTIWQTIQNTAERKRGYFYVIIDEAHRGMKDKNAATATTIMQKFLKGSDEISAMPIVIGMSATDERFKRLVENISSVRHDVAVTPGDVRDSGLLKDRIIIVYPEQENINDMTILQAAADEWKNKSQHWNYYCGKQKLKQVRPVLVIQVENRNNNNSASATELGECIRTIRNRTGANFSEHEVVHTFGQTGTLEADGLKIHHVEASDIADNEKIRVVFFKENLSTGWDCPRAETMMSFRHAEDSTYIAQLLGRMIRTPLQRRVISDESLNEVRLFLPYFNKDNVETVAKDLQNEEGSEIPAYIEGEEYSNPLRETWGIHPRVRKNKILPGQYIIEGTLRGDPVFDDENVASTPINPVLPTHKEDDSEGENTCLPCQGEVARVSESEGFIEKKIINREEIAKFINDEALITYEIKPFRATAPLPSMIRLAELIKNSGLNPSAVKEIQNECAKMIEDYITELKNSGKYEKAASSVKKLNLSWKIFDAFGESVSDRQYKFFMTSSEDLNRQFDLADRKLGDFGLGGAYGKNFSDSKNPYEFLVHVILFAADENCYEKFCLFAKNKFNELSDNFRLKFANMPIESYRKQYDEIISEGNEVSEHSFRLPERISTTIEKDGDLYSNHFFVNEEKGYARIKLNSWEKAVIEEESKRDDFVCWLRNPSREKWGLCLQRSENDVIKGFYPDFLIVRNVPGTGYLIDILEPHQANLTDNLSKAKALMRYMERQPSARIGRIQLIREEKDSLTGRKKIKRLDFSKSSVRDEVKRFDSTTQLDKLFSNDDFLI